MLYDLLAQYNKKGVTPMHMPGHKRNTGLLGEALPYGIDITEIDGFDNLHDAHDVLKETAELAAELYGSKRAFPLVNGSTGGLLAAVRSAARYGDEIIMARNCHKSIYNAIEVNGLRPIYLMPEIDEATGICGSIKPEQVKNAALKNPRAKLIIITSPTYEGVVSDIKAICDIAHQYKIPVLVDSAHGAHFGFSSFFACDAVRSGADLVITSLHKTLPALTQCALGLLSGALIDENRLASELAIFQTSSPSYVLLSSIDRCLRLLADDGSRLFDAYTSYIRAFDERMRGLGKLRVLCHGTDTLSRHKSFHAFDPGKIVINTGDTDLNGARLMALLRENYHIELEMAAPDYALAMTSICDSAEAFEKLAEALLDIDNLAEICTGDAGRLRGCEAPRQVLPPARAMEMEGKYLPLNESAGMMSLEYIWAYPPGIPFIVPGELIRGDMLDYIRRIAASGVAVISTRGMLPDSAYCAEIPSSYL